MKGGKSSGRSSTSPTPFLQNGFTNGASSSREQAAANTSNMNAKQSSIFSKSGGKRKSKRGGKSTGRITTSSRVNSVPQFSSGVGAGPVNANTSSVQNNQTSTQTVADAAGDCWATNSCSGGGVSFQNWHEVFPIHKNGGKKRKTRSRKANKRKTKSKRYTSKKQIKNRRNSKKKMQSTCRRRR
jgi:hypothetical protein